MAKLNVTVPAVDVEVNGVKYRKVDRDAQVGDIIRYMDDSDYVTKGAFYAVTRIDGADDPQIVDNDGDEHDLCGEEFEVYAKVSETTGEYREVKRWAEPGERIRIVNKDSVEDRYENGAEFVVDSVDGDGDVRVTAKSGYSVLVLLSEYAVLEHATAKEPAPRRLTVGDYVKVTRGNGRVHVGVVYVIAEVDSSDIPYRLEEINGARAGWKVGHEVVRATDEEVADAKRKLAAETTTADPRSQFAKGEKVRLISGGGEYPLNGYDNGEIYEVDTPLYEPHDHGAVIQIVGGDIPYGYAKPEQLAKLTIEVGSTVRLTIEEGKTPRYKWGKVSNGAIGTVTNIDGTSAYVNFPNQRWWHALLSELTLVTDGEKPQPQPEPVRFKVGEYARTLTDVCRDLPKGSIVKITRVDSDSRPFRAVLLDDSDFDFYCQDELERVDVETVKWAMIGREVNEFKAGDIVTVDKPYGAPLERGQLVTVRHDSDSAGSVSVTEIGWSVSVSSLVTPVEQRFDRMELEATKAAA
ncbi:hypothetical protein PPSQR21_032680 [Paenibacillus polymyxa SQR-21]|uniref:hypothetical protein n=1 Tax=Paenibacillus polymyxa TaxID=1406 RepID=UPI00042EB18A|nr:hypothetical protein [Paenibacillus polymyxa]AHM66907.1 hypothetical protein PPSQR21_032680 [Paenibacillus polymyxa SQR-21]